MTEETFTIKLVQEIEKHDCLYDYSKKSYSNDRAKTSARDAMSKTVNISGEKLFYYNNMVIFIIIRAYVWYKANGNIVIIKSR